MTDVHKRWCTLIFVLAATTLVIGYDIPVIRTRGVEFSISRVFRHTFGRHPTVFVAFVFWVGVLIGHIWLSAVIDN